MNNKILSSKKAEEIRQRLLNKNDFKKSDLYMLLQSKEFKTLPLIKRTLKLRKIFEDCKNEKGNYDCKQCSQKDNPNICPFLHLFPNIRIGKEKGPSNNLSLIPKRKDYNTEEEKEEYVEGHKLKLKPEEWKILKKIKKD